MFICPFSFPSFSVSSSLTSSCLPSLYVSFIFSSCFPSSLVPSFLSGGSVWVWKTVIKEMPPLLLGVIIYERGHINVTTANTVCPVHVCVCHRLSGPWCQHGPLCFTQHSLLTYPPNPPSRSLRAHSVFVCVCFWSHDSCFVVPLWKGLILCWITDIFFKSCFWNWHIICRRVSQELMLNLN